MFYVSAKFLVHLIVYNFEKQQRTLREISKVTEGYFQAHEFSNIYLKLKTLLDLTRYKLSYEWTVEALSG